MPEQAAVAAEVEGREQVREKEHKREFYLINKIATITAHSQDLQDIMNKVLVAVLEFFGVEAGLLLLWNRKKQRLSYAASRGFPGKYLVDIARSGLEAVVGDNLARANQPLIIRDVRKDPRLHTSTFTELIREDPSFRALVSIPLKYRDEVTGFLNLAAESAAPFRASRRKKYFLSILGNQIGLAIENARLYHELHRSEHRYRRIFEGSKDMIFVTDREGRLLDLNPAGVELLKFASKQEALGLEHVREIFQEPRDWERFQLQVEVEGFIRDMELTLSHPGAGAGAHRCSPASCGGTRTGASPATRGFLRTSPSASGRNGSCCGRRRPPKASWRACRCRLSSSTGTTGSSIGTRPARS